MPLRKIMDFITEYHNITNRHALCLIYFLKFLMMLTKGKQIVFVSSL